MSDSAQIGSLLILLEAQMARNIQNTLGKEMFSGFHDGVKGMLRDWAQMLLQMVEQIEAAQLLNHFFGSYDSSGNGSGQAGLSAVISKGLSSMFGGGKAGGGDVSAGSYYQVAENGPELYTDSSGNNFLLPSSNGWITPTSGLGGGAGGSVAVNIDARGAGPDETAKLLAMSGALENSIKAQVEHRLQRGGWPSPPRRTA